MALEGLGKLAVSLGELRRRARRTVFALVAAGAVAAAVLGVTAAPAGAYGKANWQLAFSGTGPGFGFWGWCDFAGGTTFNDSGQAISGTTGDCQFAEYFHQPGVFSGTCEVSLDLTAEGGQPAWQEAHSDITQSTDWFISGTTVTHPASQTDFCATLPGSPPPTFSNFDSLLPVAVGHTNASGFFGTTTLQIQETPLS